MFNFANYLKMEKILIIKISTKKKYDSQYSYPPVTIFYNKADLQEWIRDCSEEKLSITKFFNLMDFGKVAVYSQSENKLVSEIKREVYDNDFERRIQYYLPSGIRFVDVKTMCKTP